MRRLFLAIALAAGALAAAAYAEPEQLMPGVTYERQVQFTPHGPVAMHVVTAPRPGGLWTLRPALSDEAIAGLEPLTALQKRLAASATVVGLDGDYFSAGNGHPTGMLMRAGVVDHAPATGRSSLGIDATGALRIGKVQLLGTWQGSGPRRPLTTVNEPPGPNGMALFTPAWGERTPGAVGSVEVTVAPFPAAAPNTDLAGPVTAVGGGGGTVIPAGGAVLVGRGVQAQKLQAEGGRGGQKLTVRMILKGDWAGVTDAIGGGPALVADGVALFRPAETFAPAILLGRLPRGAVGQRADGSILLVTVDEAPGISAGMTSFELAQAMARLGAVRAMALGSGRPAGLAFEGTLLSRPAGGETPIADALLVLYGGVWVPPVAPVVSPNGDGAADQQTLAYKLVRPATVSATLTGPDGTALTLDAGDRAAGAYSFTWPAAPLSGEAEGRWRWQVTATEPGGASSADGRDFVVDRTLESVRAAAATFSTPAEPARPLATFGLTRRAKVTARVLSATGAVVGTVLDQTLEPGRQTVSWDGRNANGAPAPAGRYSVAVAATSELGRVEVAVPVTVRRGPGT